jgi:hypothetical protein
VLTPSDRSRPVIAATLPVVGENIGTIAERFYEHIFAEHPDLLDGLFNRGNQAEGTQQRALAGSVAVFAAALVHHPGRLPYQLLSRVAHKHASLGLRPLVLHVDRPWCPGRRGPRFATTAESFPFASLDGEGRYTKASSLLTRGGVASHRGAWPGR